MLDVIDGGMITWDVNHVWSQRLNEAHGALLDAFADMDVVEVEAKAKALASVMIEAIVAEEGE